MHKNYQERRAALGLIPAMMADRGSRSGAVKRLAFLDEAGPAQVAGGALGAWSNPRSQGACQSSMTKPGTRLNSAVLCVTSVQPWARAIAAICRSRGPINCPIDSK
jgi:hypothetical protein